MTKEKHIIQPLSSGTLGVSIGLSRKQRKGTYLLSPLENSPLLNEEPGLLLPPTLINGKQIALISYINQTTKAFSIPKGQVVGLIERIDRKDISDESHSSPVDETLAKGIDFDKYTVIFPQSTR